MLLSVHTRRMKFESIALKNRKLNYAPLCICYLNRCASNPMDGQKRKKKKKSAECLHLHIKISRTNWLSYFRVWFASFFSQFTWGKSLCGRIAKQKKNSRQTNKDANNHISSSIVHIPWFFRLLSGALWIFFGCWLLSAWIVHSYNVRDKSENSLWIIQWCVDRNTTLVFIP